MQRRPARARASATAAAGSRAAHVNEPGHVALRAHGGNGAQACRNQTRDRSQRDGLPRIVVRKSGEEILQDQRIHRCDLRVGADGSRGEAGAARRANARPRPRKGAVMRGGMLATQRRSYNRIGTSRTRCRALSPDVIRTFAPRDLDARPSSR